MAITEEDLKKAPTESLINYITTYRLIKINRELAIMCMKELDERRQNGEEINYEEEIEKKLKDWKSKLPESKSLPGSFNAASILEQLGLKF
jgi:hypothetical protein